MIRWNEDSNYIDPRRREAFLSEVIKIIRCIILSTKCSITCEELSTDYQDLEGQPIPFKRLGFCGLYDFLRSLRNVVQVDAETDVIKLVNENGDPKSEHVRKMVSNCSKTYEKRQRFVEQRPRALYTPRDSSPGTVPEVFCTLKDLDNRDLFIHNDIQLYALSLINRNKGLDTKTFEVELNKYIREQSVQFLYGDVDKLLARLSHLFVVRNHKIYPNLGYFADDVKEFGTIRGNDKFVPLVPLKTKVDLSDLLEANPHGIVWYDLLTKYKEAYKKDLDFLLYGFTGIIPMIGSMPTLYHYKMAWGEYHFFDARKPYPPAAQVTPKAVINTQRLLKLFRGVVDLKYFEPLYQLVFQETFNYTFMRYESLEEALRTLNSEGILVVPVHNDRLALLESRKSDIMPAIHPFLGVNGPMSVTYPEGVMIPQNKIPRLVISENLQVKESITIICLDSFGPHYFFARFVTEEFFELESEMTLFYKEEKKDLKIPPKAYTLGLVCVASFAGGYQRVIIVGLPKNTPELLVLRVDYGGVLAVPLRTLYYMPTKFAALPTQAFLCSLVGIIPPLSEKVFSPETFSYFNSITKGKLVIADVHTIDRRNLALSISITCILNGNKKFNVAEDLISKGFAERSARRKPIRDPSSYAYWMLLERMYPL